MNTCPSSEAFDRDSWIFPLEWAGMVRLQSLAGVTGKRIGPVYFRERPIVFGGGRDFGCVRFDP